MDRGQGLPMNVIVIAAIAVIVLLVVGAFFSGGFRTMGKKIMNFVTGTTGESEETTKSVNCAIWCMQVQSGIDGGTEGASQCADTGKSCPELCEKYEDDIKGSEGYCDGDTAAAPSP